MPVQQTTLMPPLPRVLPEQSDVSVKGAEPLEPGRIAPGLPMPEQSVPERGMDLQPSIHTPGLDGLQLPSTFEPHQTAILEHIWDALRSIIDRVRAFLDPNFTHLDVEQKAVVRDLEKVTKSIENRVKFLDRKLAEGDDPALRAERREYYGLLNSYADIGAHLGTHGVDAVEDLAEALFGGDALVVERPAGSFSIWNNKEPLAPAMVAQLPSCSVLDKDSFDVEPLGTPPAMGSIPEDLVLASASPQVAHIAAALPGGNQLTIADLYKEGALNFTSPPDPTDMLEASHAVNASRDVPKGEEISLISYNVALLDYKLFGVWSYKKTPLIDERREKIAKAVFEGGDGVIMLQELWRDEDLELFTKLAKQKGYRPFVAPRHGYSDGLVSFVKEDMIDPDQPVTHRAKTYETQRAKEYWAAEITSLGTDVGVKRGYHEISFEHPTLGKINFFNTHMMSYVDAWSQRMQQCREIGLASKAKQGDGVVLIGGDLNAGTYYPKDDFEGADGSVTKDWLKNGVAIPLLGHYANANDLVIAGRPFDEVDDEVEVGNEPRPDGHDPMWPYSYSDHSNSLAEEQYGVAEFRARLDHLFGGESDRMKVVNSEMVFTEDVEVAPGVVSELSDHYAVRSRIRIAPPE